jgi:AraC family transcriptional regulator
MSERSRLEGKLSTDRFSVQVYDGDVIFSPEIEFVKWATMEVNDSAEIPEGMSELIVPAGKYAVFLHKGPAMAFPKTLSVIMAWMDKNGFTFDKRPQFEILSEDYPGPMSPDAEEEVWIPIRSI